MQQKSLTREAEELWLRLCSAQAEAHAAGELGRALRIEPLKENAWWRLQRRLNLTRPLRSRGA